MKHTIKQTPEPAVEADFWRKMGWKFCYVKGLKRFATIRKQYRLKVWGLLNRAPKYDALPVGYVTLAEAEIAWGASLVDWALFLWENQDCITGRHVRVCILAGQPMVLLREATLLKHYGKPKWVSTKQVAEKHGLDWRTVYHRLRYSSCRRKAVRRWIGGYHLVFNAEDVESEVQLWRTYGRGSNTLHCGRRLKEFDSNDEISRSQWRQKLTTRG